MNYNKNFLFKNIQDNYKKNKNLDRYLIKFPRKIFVGYVRICKIRKFWFIRRNSALIHKMLIYSWDIFGQSIWKAKNEKSMPKNLSSWDGITSLYLYPHLKQTSTPYQFNK